MHRTQKTESQVMMYKLTNVVEHRAVLLFDEDVNGVLAHMNTVISESLTVLEAGLSRGLPPFARFYKVEVALKELEDSLREFLWDNHSRNLLPALMFKPPNKILFKIGLDEYADRTLSKHLH